jgi:hypothetical protein
MKSRLLSAVAVGATAMGTLAFSVPASAAPLNTATASASTTLAPQHGPYGACIYGIDHNRVVYRSVDIINDCQVGLNVKPVFRDRLNGDIVPGFCRYYSAQSDQYYKYGVRFKYQYLDYCP